MTADFYFQRLTPKGFTDSEKMTPSSSIILQEAEKHGVSYRSIPGTRVIELEYQGKKQYFKAQIPFQTSFIGSYLAEDKSSTKASLIHQGISVPKGYSLISTDPQSYWEEVYHALTKPLVVKPSNMNKGQNVFINIDSLPEYLGAVADCFSQLSGNEANVVVEEMFDGKEYRITATQEKVLAILNRVPANVIGDGQQSISQLVAQKNADPRRVDDPNGVLVKLKLDEDAVKYLAEQGMRPESVPSTGKQVFLRQNSNISTGGDSIDVTDIAHPSVSEIALRAMKAFPGLAFAGIDFMTRDITQPQTQDTYTIIEVNTSPGFCIHDDPYQGENRHVAREFLYILFPKLRGTLTV